MKNIVLIVLVLLCFKTFPQTAKIRGKLLLQDKENIESVRRNTYVIIKTKTMIDSVNLDNDLNFVFNNIKADTIRMYIRPRSYPIDMSYKFYFNGKKSKKIKLIYSSTCPFGKKENNICPVCKKKDKVISIRYGLIVGITDDKENGKVSEKYKMGGCVVSECQPNWYCERDEKEF